jgi:hypothetical protein
MNLIQAFFLGIIQGLTEFIPVSSTAHLLIAQNLMGLNSNGQMFSFLVLVQMGTILALLIYFWRDFLKIGRAVMRLIKRQPFHNLEGRLGWLAVDRDPACPGNRISLKGCRPIHVSGCANPSRGEVVDVRAAAGRG